MKFQNKRMLLKLKQKRFLTSNFQVKANQNMGQGLKAKLQLQNLKIGVNNRRKVKVLRGSLLMINLVRLKLQKTFYCNFNMNSHYFNEYICH